MSKKRVFTLQEHLTAVKDGERKFENAFQAVSRMILGNEIDKIVVNGKTTYDFKIFRGEKKHIIGLYDEINSFVSYVKDAAEGAKPGESSGGSLRCAGLTCKSSLPDLSIGAKD
jgi:serine protein kinase